MSLLLLLILDSWQVAYGQGLLEQLHTYDIVRMEVQATPGDKGVAVDCRLTIRVKKPGPQRFFLSSEVDGLTAERDGKVVQARLGEGGFAKLLQLLAKKVQGVPGLLTLPAPAAGEATYRLQYVWRPVGQGLAYASKGAVQTHLSSFWLPSMADEFFEVKIDVKTDRVAVMTRSKQPRQVACLVVGDFVVHRRGKLELYLPRDVKADETAMLDDLAAVLKQLEKWFGPTDDEGFRLVVEPRNTPVPSYCAGSFAVLSRRALGLQRPLWLAHLAHECSHAWFGHKLGSPVVGAGGTWLREGLAEWAGIEVATALQSPDIGRRLWRSRVRAYTQRIDLRKNKDGTLFANEPTLDDATYLDDPSVPYWRGALVHRILARSVGEEAFRERLKGLIKSHAYRFATTKDYAAAVGTSHALIAYYAMTSRLPDFEIRKVEPGSAEIVCNDPELPALLLPCLVDKAIVFVELRGGKGVARWPAGDALRKRIEIDPERIFLDPVRSNSVWERK